MAAWLAPRLRWPDVLHREWNGMHLVRRVTRAFMNALHSIRGRGFRQAIDNARFRVSPGTLENDVFLALNGKIGFVRRLQILFG